MTGDDGNVTIIVAVMLTALLGAGAIVVDVGAMYLQADKLQAGADAAALAIAGTCSTTPALCDNELAEQLADEYLGDNAGTLSVIPPVITFDSAQAGSVVVQGRSDVAPLFAGVLGVENHRVGASATARWGPVLEHPVFPLTVCRGALDVAIDSPQPVLVESYPPGDDAPGICEGAPDALPLGWIHSTGEDCTAEVGLEPPTTLDIEPSDVEPGGCDQSINDLLNTLADDDSTADDRTRVLAVHDAGSNAAYSLIAFEFTGIRIREDERDRDIPWEGNCGQFSEPYLIGDLQCIRGYVRTWNPPEDGPLADVTTLDLAGIDATTVLGVRLVD